MIRTPIYEDCFLDHTEDVENYRAGGYHPVSIGHIIKEGRYEILHKLGYGAFATVWLARDLSHEIQKSTLGSLVCLKISIATPAEQNVETYGEVQIPRVLVTTGRCKEFLCAHILPAAEPFIEHGPNGFCLCVVLAVAGPSLLEVCHRISGRVLGSRRLRSELARTIASQVAHFVHGMHDAGCVHGGK
jgi:serine/threonine-protein kinase SRPK3